MLLIQIPFESSRLKTKVNLPKIYYMAWIPGITLKPGFPQICFSSWRQSRSEANRTKLAYENTGKTRIEKKEVAQFEPKWPNRLTGNRKPVR